MNIHRSLGFRVWQDNGRAMAQVAVACGKFKANDAVTAYACDVDCIDCLCASTGQVVVQLQLFANGQDHVPGLKRRSAR